MPNVLQPCQVYFLPKLIDQSSCGILITHAKTRPILHYDWSISLGGNRPDRAVKHLAAMLSSLVLHSGNINYHTKERKHRHPSDFEMVAWLAVSRDAIENMNVLTCLCAYRFDVNCSV